VVLNAPVGREGGEGRCLSDGESRDDLGKDGVEKIEQEVIEGWL